MARPFPTRDSTIRCELQEKRHQIFESAAAAVKAIEPRLQSIDERTRTVADASLDARLLRKRRPQVNRSANESLQRSGSKRIRDTRLQIASFVYRYGERSNLGGDSQPHLFHGDIRLRPPPSIYCLRG